MHVNGRILLQNMRLVAVTIDNQMPQPLQSARQTLDKWTVKVAVNHNECAVGNRIIPGKRACFRCKSSWHWTVVVVGAGAALGALLLNPCNATFSLAM
mmetsp:Transcript_19137/g.27803  ORF Transcript_19137/g.27803 Transcript_19137/m.27803 type:complete len:98 (+) Transcript_19137:1160-1453(+)